MRGVGFVASQSCMEGREHNMGADRRYQGKRVAAPSTGAAGDSNVPKREQTQSTRKSGFWHEYGYLLITVVVVFVLCRGVFQLAFVPTGSMETTIPTNSLLIAWRLPYLVSDPVPERGDVAIFWDEEMHKILVKRVIGLPGEEISFSDGYTYINGQKLEETYLPQQGITQGNQAFQMPVGGLFMMGDNRTDSWDSRFLTQPYIPVHEVQGRAMVCIPLLKITLIETQKLGPINIYLPKFGSTHTL